CRTETSKTMPFFSKGRVGHAPSIRDSDRRAPPLVEHALPAASYRRPTVYLFACPTEFGDVFVQTALAETRRLGLDLTLVRSLGWSAKRSKRGGSVRARLRRLRRAWSEWRLSRRFRGRLLMVWDVNDPNFVSGIAPGDHGIIASFDQIFRAPLIGTFAS